jgi:thiol-disulfide isomerase/thioredoxin
MVAGNCCPLSAQRLAIVDGKWERGAAETVKFFRIHNGDLEELASSKIGTDKRFAFAVNLDAEGFYAIGEMPSAINRYLFYLKPGDVLHVTITKDSYLLSDDNTPENKEMLRWHNFVFPLEDHAVYFMRKISSYKEFFPLLEEKTTALQSYPKIATGNARFDAAFEDFKRNDLLFLAIHFLQTPRVVHPSATEYTAYYRNLSLPELTKNTSLLRYPHGVKLLLDTYMTQITRIDTSANAAGKTPRLSDAIAALLKKENVQLVQNDTLRSEIALLASKDSKTGTEQKFSSGKDAIDFRFSDVNGKQVALSDFKGKVVYIDVWATWCAPCRAEIPHLKKLESEYEANDKIVFIGVSVDKTNDLQKWKDFLIKEQLPGIQLFAGDAAKEQLLDPYKITGIPRFILVGKDGKLANVNAPRPSSERIRALLQETLDCEDASQK